MVQFYLFVKHIFTSTQQILTPCLLKCLKHFISRMFTSSYMLQTWMKGEKKLNKIILNNLVYLSLQVCHLLTLLCQFANLSAFDGKGSTSVLNICKYIEIKAITNDKEKISILIQTNILFIMGLAGNHLEIFE